MNADTLNSLQNASAERFQAEILDDEAAIDETGVLGELLRDWNAVVGTETGKKSFIAYDSEACAQQQNHVWIVTAAAITGSIAVLLAIWHLTSFARADFQALLPKTVIEVAEPATAILALIAVGLGIGAAVHTQWRLLRFRAERYPFLKVRFLLAAPRWLGKKADQRREYLQAVLGKVHELDPRDARAWAQGLLAAGETEFGSDVHPDPVLVEALVGYLLEKRIEPQAAYFQRQIEKREGVERLTRYIAPACFFLSIACALAHTFAGASGEECDREVPAIAALWLVFGSAALPVIGATVRTVRGAFEFGRNATRFEGVHRQLEVIQAALKDKDRPAAAKLELLREAERVLANEHQSWMRLMTEAEWFG